MVKEEIETKAEIEENNAGAATAVKKKNKSYTAKKTEMKSKINNLKSEIEEKNKSTENEPKKDNELQKEIEPQKEIQKNDENKNEQNAKEITKKKESTAKNNNPSNFEQVKPESEKTRSGFTVFSFFLIIFLSILLTLFVGFTVYNYKNSSKISKGIYISNIDVSNLTLDEAKSKIKSYYEDKLSNDITLIHNDYTSYIKTSEIELSYNLDDAVQYAFNIGKTKNIFSDNFQVFNAMVNGINIAPIYTYNEEALEKILNSFSAELPDTVIESGYYIEGSNLIITQGKDGVVIDTKETSKKINNLFVDLSQVNTAIELITIAKSPDEVDVDKIYKDVYKEAKDAYFTTEPHEVHPASNGIDFAISIEEAKKIVETAEGDCTIPLKILTPNISTNMLGQEAFPDLISTFSTKYAASNTNRTTNLRLAANKINGYVLLPGETFSYNSVVGERTIAAGYKDAAIYQNGEVVQGLGGGICQISTTLYNATLFANLEIVELYNHQFVPSYVGAGRDATVVYGVKDFKFKNTRNHAIKITCSVSGGVATFNIWGYKEPTEYDVSVYASVTARTPTYIKSSTYRTIKQNGQVIKSENIINSTYKVH